MAVEKTYVFSETVRVFFTQSIVRRLPFTLINVFGLKKRLASVKLLFRHHETKNFLVFSRRILVENVPDYYSG